MTAGGSRSARYVDPASREVAEDLARRSGLSLNEWVARLMAEGPEDATSQDYFSQSPSYVDAPRAPQGASRYEAIGHPADEVSRVTQAIERLSDRIETAENRQALAIAGIERSVREVITRIDAAEREQMQVAARFEGAVQGAKEENVRLAERLRRIEEEAAGPRSAEALRALEGALGKVAGHVYEGEKRQRETLAELGRRVERLDGAEQATLSAMRELKNTCSTLDERLSLTERGAEVGIQAAASNLSERVEAVREDLGRQLAAAADARFDRVEQALAQMSQHVRAAEERSAGAVERMGREVLEVAQTLSRRVQGVEHRSAESADRLGAEVSRIATAVEDRLTRADSVQAQALEKLGSEIARITERLADRIANAERRSAQAIDDVGEQVSRVTERVSQRTERSASELAERIRQSEERTARLLEEARQKIDERLAETQRKLDAPPPRAAAAYDDADDSLFGDAPFPGYETPPAERPFPRAAPSAPFAAALGASSFAAGGLAASAGSAEPAFDDEDFEAATAFDAPDEELHEEAHAEEPQVEAPPAPNPFEAPLERALIAVREPDPEPMPQTVAAKPTPRMGDPDYEDVELEPNVGFDVDDDFIKPAASAAPPRPLAASSAEALFAPDDDADPAEAPVVESHPVEPHAASSLTTREVIERARAAARAASDNGRGRPSARPSNETVLEGLTFGRSRKRPGGMSGALMVASLMAAVGLSAGGYMVLEGKPGGKLPKRVEDALSVVRGDQPSQVASATPVAAMAVAAPATGGGPDLTAAYSAAVAKIAANQPGGLIDIRKLADGGYAPAQFYLGELYQDGKAGLKKDAVQSRHWLEKAADGGDRTAMHNLALDEHEGVGGPKNAPAAAEWFRRAAELGLLDSQYNLAAIYEHGDGVSQNPAEAYKWYLIAAKSGDQESRTGALRVRSALTPDARAVAERAAADFQPSQPNASVASAPAAIAPNAASPALVTAQRALNQLGYYQGPTDGAASPALRLAIAAYQRDQALPVTGAPDAATIQKLSVYTQ